MDFGLLFNWQYMTETAPGGDFVTGFFLLLFFGGLLFTKQFFSSQMKNNKHFRKSIKKRLWKFPLLGGIGLLLVLARFGDLPGLSMRLILLIWLLLSLVVIIWTSWKTHASYRERVASAEREKKKF